jgi:Uma2 family endonuclease
MTEVNQTAPLVAEDLYEIPDDDKRYELVDGELRVSEPPSVWHGALQVRLVALLHAHVRANRLGLVVSESGFVLRRGPDTVRGPDVAYIRTDRLPSSAAAYRFYEGAPDLVAEVVSPSDRAWEVAEKVEGYLTAGTRLVWVVDPRNRHVVAHTPDRTARVLREGDTLDGGDVLPGFRLDVAELFAPPA